MASWKNIFLKYVNEKNNLNPRIIFICCSNEAHIGGFQIIGIITDYKKKVLIGNKAQPSSRCVNDGHQRQGPRCYPVKQSVKFFLIPPTTSRSSEYQNSTMAKVACNTERFSNAECVRLVSNVNTVWMTASAISVHTHWLSGTWLQTLAVSCKSCMPLCVLLTLTPWP